jgi:putative phosphotransacetylase
VLARLAADAAAGAADKIPVGVSGRHVHLCPEHVDRLFGGGKGLTRAKELGQPGEFAAAETVTLVGPKGVLRNVRVLGPARQASQVEIARSDGFILGIAPPVRDSGSVAGSAGLTLVGPHGAVTLTEGVICAARHIHLSSAQAAAFSLADGDRVAVDTQGPRAVCFYNVRVRVGPQFCLEFHIDTDEANAAGLANGDFVSLRRG